MKKKLFGAILTMTMAGIMTMTSMAAQGKWIESNGRWWYDNGNGTYKQNGWHWIDGNGDGTAECYYFDASGWLITNAATPDGYQVNANGAWVENGVVQTKIIGTAVEQQDEFTGEFVRRDVINNDTLTVTKNADGTYHFVKVVDGIVQYEVNANKGERIDNSMYKFFSDEVLFTDTETGKVYFCYYYSEGTKFSERFIGDDIWCEKPDYEKLDELKANRKFEGLFFLEEDPEGIYSRLLVTKKAANLYNFKYISDGEVWNEYDAVPSYEESFNDGYTYDFVGFYDAEEGYYRIGYELPRTADHYNYWLAGDGWTDIWNPAN